MPTTSELSVVIPSYRSRYLPEALASLQGLGALEILVVDSSPQPPTDLPEGATLVRSPERLAAGKARNVGARQARGKYLLFLDSDVLLPPRAHDFIRRFLESPGDGFVTGVYDPVQERTNIISRHQSLMVLHRIWYSRGLPRPMFSSSHFIIAKEDFDRAGGFNEEISTYEDFEFYGRLIAFGKKLQLSMDFVGVHRKTYSWVGLLRESVTKTFNASQVRARYPQPLRLTPACISPSLLASWLSGPLLAFLWTAGLALGWRPGALLTASALILPWPLLLMRDVLALEAPVARVLSLPAWPLMGLAVAAGVTLSRLASAWGSVKRGALFAADLGRAAWRIVLRTGMPVQIVAYVTARCNLRCEHCFYKETLDAPDPGELSLEVFDRSTREIGPVLWFSLGGGEPFVRKDLDRLIEVIQRNCRPKVFSFPTNGWYTEKTFEVAQRVLWRLQQGNLILFFSLDGPREVHDQIRGPGSFDRVKATMERLRPLTRLYPNLYLNVVTTVTERNCASMAGFVDELVRDFTPSAISINLFRYHSLEHPPIPDSVLEGYRAAAAAYERHLRGGALRHYGFFGGRVLLFKELLQKELIYRVAKSNEFVTPCTAGTLSYVIMEDGRLQPCEILPDTLGNVRTGSKTFRELISSPEAKRLRTRIEETECKCTYECAMSTNTLFSWPMSRRLAKALAADLVGA